MTWFSLPSTQAENKAAFSDSRSATAWLAGQPQANATAMLAGLVAELQVFNGYRIEARERFKTLEVLRKAIFAVSGECQRRYENKPLPLLPAEHAQLDKVRQLWRTCSVAYLHCLRSCLDGDPAIVGSSAKVAHRVLSSLRMEQMNCYLAGAELDGDFWRNLHAVLAAAEQLGVVSERVEDRMLGETSESTPGGQYGMALLLHLARPFSLTRGQFSAVTRWLARWREQVKILAEPDQNPKSRCVALDLAQDKPIHDHLRVAGVARWFSIGNVLRKIRHRLELLAAGELPENLKLGSGLSAEACVELLNLLSDHLKCPQKGSADAPENAPSIIVSSGLENSFRLLGGKGLTAPALQASAFGNQLSQEQIAVFGHVVRDESGSEGKLENWQLVRQDPGMLQLIRRVGNGEARLTLRGLLALKMPQNDQVMLATISSLYSRNDGSLSITASVLSGTPVALIAEVREKPSGKISNHPAVMLPADKDGSVSSLLLPTGLPFRALSIRFQEAREQSSMNLRLADIIERGGDCERWAIAVDE
jgi:hypothetical protein